MENKQMVIWENNAQVALPKSVKRINELIVYGIQLQLKDRRQIEVAFNNEAYEMVASYTWTKAMTSLKHQLSKMGISFVAEMLDRPDINEYSNIQQAISDYEAIRLSEELGVISKTSAFRLRKAMDTVSHFNELGIDDDPENEMSEDEAKTILRSCIEAILGYNKIEAAIDFKNFRKALEETTLGNENDYIQKLIQSPYFFHRAVIRILLSLIKTSSGAQLENSLANANLIIPKIWNKLQHPEKWQVGRTYSELFSDGQKKASSGLKKLLLRVKGFDFVPEDLRSAQFIKVANEILLAHHGMDNFYNEPSPVNTLNKMGSVIPAPAFSVCMTAILSVKIGNYYGVSIRAQSGADEIIGNTSLDRWIYFFQNSFKTNDRILYKLSNIRTADRWMNILSSELIDQISIEIQDAQILNILKYTQKRDIQKLTRLASVMYSKIGYANE